MPAGRCRGVRRRLWRCSLSQDVFEIRDDALRGVEPGPGVLGAGCEERLGSPVCVISPVTDSTELEPRPGIELDPEIGRASCRERVEIWVVVETLKKKRVKDEWSRIVADMRNVI